MSQEEIDLDSVPLRERLTSNRANYRLHGYNAILQDHRGLEELQKFYQDYWGTGDEPGFPGPWLQERGKAGVQAAAKTLTEICDAFESDPSAASSLADVYLIPAISAATPAPRRSQMAKPIEFDEDDPSVRFLETLAAVIPNLWTLTLLQLKHLKESQPTSKIPPKGPALQRFKDALNFIVMRIPAPNSVADLHSHLCPRWPGDEAFKSGILGETMGELFCNGDAQLRSNVHSIWNTALMAGILSFAELVTSIRALKIVDNRTKKTIQAALDELKASHRELKLATRNRPKTPNATPPPTLPMEVLQSQTPNATQMPRQEHSNLYDDTIDRIDQFEQAPIHPSITQPIISTRRDYPESMSQSYVHPPGDEANNRMRPFPSAVALGASQSMPIQKSISLTHHHGVTPVAPMRQNILARGGGRPGPSATSGGPSGRSTIPIASPHVAHHHFSVVGNGPIRDPLGAKLIGGGRPDHLMSGPSTPIPPSRSINQRKETYHSTGVMNWDVLMQSIELGVKKKDHSTISSNTKFHEGLGTYLSKSFVNSMGLFRERATNAWKKRDAVNTLAEEIVRDIVPVSQAAQFLQFLISYLSWVLKTHSITNISTASMHLVKSMSESMTANEEADLWDDDLALALIGIVVEQLGTKQGRFKTTSTLLEPLCVEALVAICRASKSPTLVSIKTLEAIRNITLRQSELYVALVPILYQLTDYASIDEYQELIVDVESGDHFLSIISFYLEDALPEELTLPALEYLSTVHRVYEEAGDPTMMSILESFDGGLLLGFAQEFSNQYVVPLPPTTTPHSMATQKPVPRAFSPSPGALPSMERAHQDISMTHKDPVSVSNQIISMNEMDLISLNPFEEGGKVPNLTQSAYPDDPPPKMNVPTHSNCSEASTCPWINQIFHFTLTTLKLVHGHYPQALKLTDNSDLFQITNELKAGISIDEIFTSSDDTDAQRIAVSALVAIRKARNKLGKATTKTSKSTLIEEIIDVHLFQMGTMLDKSWKDPSSSVIKKLKQLLHD